MYYIIIVLRFYAGDDINTHLRASIYSSFVRILMFVYNTYRYLYTDNYIGIHIYKCTLTTDCCNSYCLSACKCIYMCMYELFFSFFSQR